MFAWSAAARRGTSLGLEPQSARITGVFPQTGAAVLREVDLRKSHQQWCGMCPATGSTAQICRSDPVGDLTVRSNVRYARVGWPGATAVDIAQTVYHCARCILAHRRSSVSVAWHSCFSHSRWYERAAAAVIEVLRAACLLCAGTPGIARPHVFLVSPWQFQVSRSSRTPCNACACLLLRL